MNCTGCGKPLPAGAQKCPACGAKISGGDEIDLLPMEEKKPAFDPYASGPPVPGAPTPAKGIHAEGSPLVAPPRRQDRSEVEETPSLLQDKRVLAVGGGIVLILVIFFAWRLFRTENKIVSGRPKADLPSAVVQPNQTMVQDFVVSGKVNYTLEVTPADGELLIGVAKRNPKDLKAVNIVKKLSNSPAPKGQLSEEKGVAETGEWSWFLINESKKPVKAKVKFLAEPQ